MYRRRGSCQSIAENKLIVCRTTGRPLIFPNVIEGVCALFENSGKKKEKIQNAIERDATRSRMERARRRGMNEEREKEREKMKKASTMQLRVGERTAGRGRRGSEWTMCSGSVLLAGFRGVEIPYNVRDVCVDSFNLPPRSQRLSRTSLRWFAGT